MKVGILTFHFADNYGAVLQTFATVTWLREQGFEPIVIDYFPTRGPLEPLFKTWRKNGSLQQGIIRKLGKLITCRQSAEHFEEFRKRYLPRSKRCESTEEVARVCEAIHAIIVGSDQVWHLDRPRTYFLNWPKISPTKRISYAPSAGHGGQTAADSDEISHCVSRFDAVSARDSVTQALITEVCGVEPSLVCDPTVLVDDTDVWPMLNKQSEKFEAYLLTYIIGEVDPLRISESLQLLRRSCGVKRVRAIVAPALLNWRRPKEADEVIWGPSPEYWLSLLKGCSGFVTDSFHGCLFASKFRIPFYGFYQETARSPRLLDLASRYQLSEHIVDIDTLVGRSPYGIPPVSPVTLELMAEDREQSEDFLKAALL